eukprot:1737958-Pyramimonas_sp.AAC.1
MSVRGLAVGAMVDAAESIFHGLVERGCSIDRCPRANVVRPRPDDDAALQEQTSIQRDHHGHDATP